MELRKCECGGSVCVEEFNSDSDAYLPLLWHAYCNGCEISTREAFLSEEWAIQAWNEGKVE